jgi:hypothetical protein
VLGGNLSQWHFVHYSVLTDLSLNLVHSGDRPVTNCMSYEPAFNCNGSEEIMYVKKCELLHVFFYFCQLTYFILTSGFRRDVDEIGALLGYSDS